MFNRKRKFGGMRKKRFGGIRKKFGKFNRRTTLTRPVTYKFAAPAARAKLNWYSIGTLSNVAAADWKEQMVNDDAHVGIANGVTITYMHFGICANDPRDPGQAGITNSDGNHGILKVFNTQCNGYDEWMKLYRKSVVTGCKFTVRGIGAVAENGATVAELGAGGNSAPTMLPVAVLSQFSELCPTPGIIGGVNVPVGVPDNVASLWPGGAGSGVGNPLVKRKEVMPYLPDSHNQKHAKIKIGISQYKPIKSVLGLKTVFGDEGCTGRNGVSPTKVVSANCLIQPYSDHDGVKAICLVKCTMWVTFSSRRAVAMAAHAGGHV